jgi:hypothetical protein
VHASLKPFIFHPNLRVVEHHDLHGVAIGPEILGSYFSIVVATSRSRKVGTTKMISLDFMKW